MNDIQKKPHIPKDQKFFDYLKEAWNVQELQERDVLWHHDKLHVVYSHVDNKSISFDRVVTVDWGELYRMGNPEAALLSVLDKMHNEIQDEIIQYLTPKE